MKLVLWLALLLLVPSLNAASTYTDTYNPASPTNPVAHTHSFVGGAGKNAAQILLQFTPASAKLAYSVLMVASTIDSGLALSLGSYVHINPLETTMVDLESANKGLPQTVQVGGLSTGSSVYIKVVVFDSVATSFGWTITVTEQVGLVSKCPPAYGKPPSPTSQYCINCLGLPDYGAYCSTNAMGLSNSSLASKAILSGEYAAFTIAGSTSQINFQYWSDQPQLEVFIQFKSYSTEIAGFVNCVVSPGGKAAYMIVSVTDTYQITINSGGSDVLVGVFNHNSATANFNAQYTTQQSLNILVIVLGVLGGLLLIALVVGAFFVIRRIRNPSQMIHPQASGAARQSVIQQNMLSAEQIQVYFPSVSCRIAFTSLESSSMNLKEQQTVDRDCVICLCPIEGNELMKVTYCRHLFHAHCLVEWFKKQRNCPYCREEYSKSSTVSHYQQLLKEAGKNILAGVDLAHEILKSKAKSSLVIEDLKD